MRYGFGLLLAFCFLFAEMKAQVGEKVSDVKVLNEANEEVGLPGFGEKNLLIFYVDPSHSKQNENLQNYYKAHPLNSSKVDSYGVVNLAAAPLIPNGLIKRKAKKAVKGTKGQVYFDPDNALSKAWKLAGANEGSCVVLVDKDRIIRFYKSGQVSDAEMQEVLGIVNAWK